MIQADSDVITAVKSFVTLATGKAGIYPIKKFGVNLIALFGSP